MCELLGLAFNEPVAAGVSFRGFRHRGVQNPDGWGLAWFSTNRNANVRKEPAAADHSQSASQLLTEEISSSIFIGHVRRASRGVPSLANTHPFQRTFRDADVVFAHNGTLRTLPEPTRFKPEGGTDSETAFCLLLGWMEEEALSFSKQDFFRIEDWLRKLNSHGKMNLLFSEGTALFAYRDRDGHNGLSLTYRSAPFREIKLKDEDWKIDLWTAKRETEKGFVIATRPLTNERWYDLEKGRLLVIQGGEAIYGDPRTKQPVSAEGSERRR